MTSGSHRLQGKRKERPKKKGLRIKPVTRFGPCYLVVVFFFILRPASLSLSSFSSRNSYPFPQTSNSLASFEPFAELGP